MEGTLNETHNVNWIEFMDLESCLKFCDILGSLIKMSLLICSSQMKVL